MHDKIGRSAAKIIHYQEILAFHVKLVVTKLYQWPPRLVSFQKFAKFWEILHDDVTSRNQGTFSREEEREILFFDQSSIIHEKHVRFILPPIFKTSSPQCDYNVEYLLHIELL